MSYYYDIEDDLKSYPDAWVYIIVGGRNTGKTYSALQHTYRKKKKHVFVKRTMEDTKLLCSGTGTLGEKKKDYGIDLSPYKSLNRDNKTNIKAFSIDKGVGGFWHCTEEEDGTSSPYGDPLGYLIALSVVTRVKGFDLSDCDYIIFDEFIPQPWERVNRKEGEQVMDLYKTVARDREHRGREALKLLCLANATNASNPVCNILEITDDIVEMQLKGEDVRYLEDRGILIRVLKTSEEFEIKEKQSKIYNAMKDTAWGQMAFENEFAYNDFTNVGHISLKKFLPYAKIRYKTTEYYIYFREDGLHYMTKSKSLNYLYEYNLNLENDQKRYWLEVGIDIRNTCIDGKMIFESYTMYDLIVNYKSFFKV